MRAFLALLAVLTTISALPALAQTPAVPAVPSSGSDRRLAITLLGGASAVEQVGGYAGGELDLRLRGRFSLLGQGVWVQDVVSRRQLDAAARIATFLQATQGAASQGTVDAPAVYAGGGLRIALKQTGGVRPYVDVTAGMARVTLRPFFTVAGGNVTSVLPQFGVTLGSDVTGTVTKPAFSAGFGLRLPRGRWHIDLGVRAISIQTPGQTTTVAMGGGGLGIKF
jgi:hypothetical protein